MRLPIYILLFAASLVGTAVALRLATAVRSQSGIGYATAISGGLTGLWLLVVISSFNVVSVSGGNEFSHSYPGLAVVGIVGAGVSVLILAKGSVELLGNR